MRKLLRSALILDITYLFLFHFLWRNGAQVFGTVVSSHSLQDMKMDPTYGHQINPVSRLIQVLQARNEEEPQFELVSEQGQSRYKEFTVQVNQFSLKDVLA